MITTDINYPSFLPWPIREDYATQSEQTFYSTEMVSGRSRRRQGPSIVPSKYRVTWIFTSDNDAVAFQAWYRDQLKRGLEWFNCPLKTPLGEQHYVCRFDDVYTGPDLVGLCSWRVSAVLELFEVPLAPDGWGEFPEYIRDAAILDIAVNIYLPSCE